MFKLHILGEELFDEETSTFINKEGYVFELEHSLLSVSKWESVFEKPFLSTTDKSTEEVLSYIDFMVVTPNAPNQIHPLLSDENYVEVNNYINAKQTATTFADTSDKGKSSEIITSELIYYWMIAYNIPFECERWHLNRLFSLIKICSIKNSKPKKMSRSEMAQRNQQLNAERKAKLKTNG